MKGETQTGPLTNVPKERSTWKDLIHSIPRHPLVSKLNVLLTLKRHKLLTDTMIWVSHKSIMKKWNKSVSQGYIQFDSTTWHSRKDNTTVIENRSVAARGYGWGAKGWKRLEQERVLEGGGELSCILIMVVIIKFTELKSQKRDQFYCPTIFLIILKVTHIQKWMCLETMYTLKKVQPAARDPVYAMNLHIFFSSQNEIISCSLAETKLTDILNHVDLS